MDRHTVHPAHLDSRPAHTRPQPSQCPSPALDLLPRQTRCRRGSCRHDRQRRVGRLHQALRGHHHPGRWVLRRLPDRQPHLGRHRQFPSNPTATDLPGHWAHRRRPRHRGFAQHDTAPLVTTAGPLVMPAPAQATPAAPEPPRSPVAPHPPVAGLGAETSVASAPRQADSQSRSPTKRSPRVRCSRPSHRRGEPRAGDRAAGLVRQTSGRVRQDAPGPLAGHWPRDYPVPGARRSRTG